jgi:DNA-binding GntR family transcriptional regulator
LTIENATALHQHLARAVLDLLIQQGAEPGTRLRQEALAAELGVSRTPIRGALALLASSGVVETEGRGLVLRRLPDTAPAPPGDDPEALLMVRLAHDRVGGILDESISEADLLRHTGAARGELGRALRRLEELGVVVRKPGFGWRFTPGLASLEERRSAYRFRMTVEPGALREPGYALPAGFAAEMRAAHMRFLERRWRDSHAVAYFELNAAFHRGIVAASGNRFFTHAVEQHIRLRRLLNYDWKLGAARVHQNAREHLEVLDLIEAGAMARAADALAEHLRRAEALGEELARLRARA